LAEGSPIDFYICVENPRENSLGERGVASGSSMPGRRGLNNHKLHIYLGTGTSPTRLPQASLPLSPNHRGSTLACGLGGGGSQSGWLEKSLVLSLLRRFNVFFMGRKKSIAFFIFLFCSRIHWLHPPLLTLLS